MRALCLRFPSNRDAPALRSSLTVSPPSTPRPPASANEVAIRKPGQDGNGRRRLSRDGRGNGRTREPYGRDGRNGGSVGAGGGAGGGRGRRGGGGGDAGCGDAGGAVMAPLSSREGRAIGRLRSYACSQPRIVSLLAPCAAGFFLPPLHYCFFALCLFPCTESSARADQKVPPLTPLIPTLLSSLPPSPSAGRRAAQEQGGAVARAAEAREGAGESGGGEGRLRSGSSARSC